VYVVVINKFSRRSPPVTHRIDIHDLKIPNREYKAHQLGGPDLYKECKRLRVPGVDAFMGHQELACRLATFIAEKEEAAAK
jgi:hypothetical protein